MKTPPYIFLTLLSAGMYSIYLGASGTLGYRRLTYILPNYQSGGINYASIPMGIMMVVWAFIYTFPISDKWVWFFTYVSLGCGLVGLFFNFIQPTFLTPKWYRWLKDKHGDIMPWLRQDVNDTGYSTWRKRTETIAELDDWAVDVRKRYNWEIEIVKKQENTLL